MKLFSRMLSKKTENEESVGNLDLDMDVEPLHSRNNLRADDTGEINASQLPKDDPLLADPQSRAVSRELAPDPAPDPAPEAMTSAWGDEDWDDEDWDDDEDWGEEEDIAADAAGPTGDKEHLVDEIREAMGAVSHIKPEQADVPTSERKTSELRNWAEDEEFGRRAIARSQLNTFGGDSEDRILAETNSQMTDRETSRRRSAMAHLKAAAAATKADAVLKHVVGRDPSGDPEEQSPYRDDLAKVVRPRSTSRPISRPASRVTSQSASWENGTADDDATLFAQNGEVPGNDTLEAELAAAEEERLARAPVDLSEDEFSDDTPMTSGFANSRFRVDADLEEGEDDENILSDALEEEAEMQASSETMKSDEDEDFDLTEDMDDEEQPAFGAIAPSKPEPAADPEPIAEVSAPVSGRAGRGAGRVKTRLLGFQSGDTASQDIFAATAAKAAAMRDQQQEDLNAPVAAPMLFTQYPTGWIVIIEGPGRGSCFTTFSGVSQIGRGEDQAIRLDFGDTSISRNNHAAIAYDDEQGKFFLGHGGKSNLVRLNGRPVLSTEELANNDEIRIGETTLKFIALCGEDFVWNQSEEDEAK